MRSKQRRSSICDGTGCCSRMPCTSGSAFRRSISASSTSVVVAAGKTIGREAMPIRRQALPFMRTYVADAGSSPTRIVASTGAMPFVCCLILATRCARSISIASASDLPSRSSADIVIPSIHQSIVAGWALIIGFDRVSTDCASVRHRAPGIRRRRRKSRRSPERAKNRGRPRR